MALPPHKVLDGASSRKINNVKQACDIINLKEHQNCNIGSKITANLPIGWILPIVGFHQKGSAPAACTAELFKEFVFKYKIGVWKFTVVTKHNKILAVQWWQGFCIYGNNNGIYSV